MTLSLGHLAARTTGLLAATYGVYVATTWARYGHPRPARLCRAHPDMPGDLLDRFMPTYEVGERSRLRVAAPPDATMAVARALDLGRLPVARALFRTRAWLLGERAVPLTPVRELATATQAMGWGMLADEPRALVMGTVCHPWEANPGFQPVAPAHFAAFDEPGFVRIAWAVGAEPDGEGGSVAWTETRVATTDAAARARFRPYWAVLSPGILLIRWAALRLVRREAERVARPVPAL